MNVAEAVQSRRSIRAFTDEPVDLETLRRVLDRARDTPSGSNFQPWQATILTGEPLRQLQEKMRASEQQNPPEYDWQLPANSPRHDDLRHDYAQVWYGTLGIARDDKAGRDDIIQQNIVSYNAPVLLLCFTERAFTEPQWADVGMWLQTVMLLLREEGFDSRAQQFMTFYSRLIKQEIGVSDDESILYTGLAIGHRDASKPVNNFERPRAPLDDQVRFLGFK